MQATAPIIDPPRVHPDALAIQEESLAWGRGCGLFGPARLEAYRAQRIGLLAGLTAPDATRAGSRLFADWLLLFCCLDDLLEDLRAQVGPGDLDLDPERLVFPRPDALGRISLAVASIHDRLAQVSASAARIFLRELRRQIQALLAEEMLEAVGVTMSVDSYLEIARRTVGMEVSTALVPFIHGGSSMVDLEHREDLSALRDGAAVSVRVLNDVLTVGREARSGSRFNLVLLLERELAVDRCVAEATCQTKYLHCLRSFDAQARAHSGGRCAGEREVLRFLRTAIAGHHEWARQTMRYQGAVG